MSHIFISYSHEDGGYAHELTRTLEARNFVVWIDDRMEFGSSWPQVIQGKIDTCGAFIVIMTPHSYQSQWVQNELNRAMRKGKPIFPVLLDGDEPWLSVEATQYIDVRGNILPSADFFDRVEDVLSHSISYGTDTVSARQAQGTTRKDMTHVAQHGKKTPGILELSDIQITQNAEDKTCLVDFRVTNTGRSEISINRVKFEALEVIEYHTMSYMEFSELYDLDISEVREAGDIATCNVAQVVKPGEVDRFGIVLTASQLGMGCFRGWRLQPTLLTNFGETLGKPFEVWLPYSSRGKSIKETIEEIIEEYKAFMEKIRPEYTAFEVDEKSALKAMGFWHSPGKEQG